MTASRARRSAGLWLTVVVAVSLAGCAWTNRDNRPVWNAFEEHLVPEDDVAFAVSLPLTVPGGLIAIILDTFVVHPARVVDDAAGDAGDLWRFLDWEDEYYTELAALPLRVVGTPFLFLIAFLARSGFDIDPYEPPLTPDERAARAAAEVEEHAEQWLEWLGELAAGSTRPLGDVPPPAWTEPLEQAFHEALGRATALGRVELYDAVRRGGLPPWADDPWMGLRDRDPVVRYLELSKVGASSTIPADLRRELLDDPSEAVRQVARRLWP